MRRHTFAWLLLLFLNAFCDAANKTYYDQLSICSNSAIQVTSVSLLCDSPGTYYYGGNNYRKSQKCKAGDKASLSASFTIIEEFSDGSAVYVTLKAMSDDQQKILYQHANLCNLGTMSSTSQSTCPSPGTYTISMNFYWGTSSSGDSSLFVPYVMVGFASSKNNDKFDLGGANTNMCGGDSIITWVSEVKQSGRLSGPVTSFLWSFGILLGTIGVVALFAFSMSHRNCDKLCFPDDEIEFEDDEQKFQAFAGNLDLVDF